MCVCRGLINLVSSVKRKERGNILTAKSLVKLVFQHDDDGGKRDSGGGEKNFPQRQDAPDALPYIPTLLTRH